MSVTVPVRIGLLKTRNLTAEEDGMGRISTKPDKRYIRAATLIGFDTFVAAKGGDPDKLLMEAGIATNVLDHPDGLISFRSYARLMELAARSLTNPSFGLEWAESLSPRFPGLGPIMLIAYFSKTMQDWMERTARYLDHHTNAFDLKMDVDPNLNQVTMRYDTVGPVPISRQLIEHKLAVAALMARHVTGQHDKKPIRVRFCHGAPADVTAHKRIFGCEIEFSSPVTEIIFPLEYLALPIEMNVKTFRALVDNFLRFRLERNRTADQTVSAMAASAISGLLGSGICKSETIALIVGLHEKKLQRLLAHEGTSYTEILEAVRQEQAAYLLRESSAPISAIAGLLDYTSTSAFSNAFRRWAGVTPRGFRGGEDTEDNDAPLTLQTHPSD